MDRIDPDLAADDDADELRSIYCAACDRSRLREAIDGEVGE